LLKSHGYPMDTSLGYGVKNAFPMPPPQQPPPPIPVSQPAYRPHRISTRPSREKLPMVSTSLPQGGHNSQSSPATPNPAVPPRLLPPTAPIPPLPAAASKPRPVYNPVNRSNMGPAPPPQSAPPPIPVHLPPLPNDRV
jgi:hypothetical protein